MVNIQTRRAAHATIKQGIQLSLGRVYARHYFHHCNIDNVTSRLMKSWSNTCIFFWETNEMSKELSNPINNYLAL